MKFISSYRLIIAATSLVLAVSCAKTGAPSGGPRETDPPVVLRSIPEAGATGFSGKTITITFDEFVTLDKIQEKFMISPPTEKKPTVVIRGKSVVVTIDGTLRDSTTYTLYFQDAIRDLNEGNKIENFQYVFSTGNYIDSLEFSGAVYDAYSLEIPENVLIMLHSNHADSALQKVIPDYITKLRSDGIFTLSNLRPGNYRLYALDDKNNNRFYESGEEAFAFLDTIITISSEKHYVVKSLPDPGHDHENDSLGLHTHDTLKLPMVIPEQILYLSVSPVEKYYLASASRRQAKLLEYYFPLSLDTFKFTFTAEGVTPESFFTEVNRNRDTFRIWLTDSLLYSNPLLNTIVTYPSTDREGITAYLTDTVPMRFVQPRTPRSGPPRNYVRLQSNTTPSGIPPGRDMVITADVPISRPDFNLISVVLAGDSTNTPLEFTPLFDTINPRILVIEHSLEEDKEYLLRFLPGAMTSTYGYTNDTAVIRYKIRPSASFGTFTVNVSGYEGNVILQLLDSREQVVNEQPGISPGKINFRFIENGKYRLKIIYDLDGNGRWTPGDFIRRRFPEAVSYYDEELEIKSNWDLIQDWDIGKKNHKDDKLRKQKSINK
jgi:uncharacterized protein (DUF2141 family)